MTTFNSEQGDNKAKNRLVIPAVQRGKVWNAARIETLWDSIFKNFPIGGIGCDKLCEGEAWWYWYDKFQNQEVVEVEIEHKLRALYKIAKQIGNC